MQKQIFAGLVIIACIVILISFFMPWTKILTSVTGVSKELTGAAKKSGVGDVPVGRRVISDLEDVTDMIGSMGDIKIKTVVTGYNIPVMVNNKTSKVALSLAEVLFKSVEGLGWKSYLVYLLPIFGIACAILAIIGIKQKIALVIMIAISGVISITGLYNLFTMNINNLMVKISIEKGLWGTMYAFLFISIAGIAWLVSSKKT